MPGNGHIQAFRADGGILQFVKACAEFLDIDQAQVIALVRF